MKKQRGTPLIAKILDAALMEIARVGPYDLAIEDVAKRADVNKTTIYRRWSTPHALVLAAFEHGSAKAPLPDNGSLQEDVVEAVKLMREVCRSPAMLSLARMQLTGELTGELREWLISRTKDTDCDTLVMFQRAKARGELPRDSDIELVRDLVLGSAQYMLYFRDAELPDHKLEQIVSMSLVGAGYMPASADLRRA